MDADGVEHAVQVEADSLYEAVALAVAEFRQRYSTRRTAGKGSALTVAYPCKSDAAWIICCWMIPPRRRQNAFQTIS
jgi:hypothetical protein